MSRSVSPAGVRSAVTTVLLFLLMGGVVIAILLSQFGTVRDASHPLATRDEAVGGAGWDQVRGRWAVGEDGARVEAAGPELSVMVRPVGGVEGTVEVEGRPATGWGVVVRWHDPGTYGLVVVEPDERTVSLVAVVHDRTRLLDTGALPEGGPDDRGDDGARTVSVELDGPVMRVRVDGTLVAAGRDDDLATGTRAGVAVVGDDDGARFTRFRTAPPEDAGTRMITSEEDR